MSFQKYTVLQNFLLNFWRNRSIVVIPYLTVFIQNKSHVYTSFSSLPQNSNELEGVGGLRTVFCGSSHRMGSHNPQPCTNVNETHMDVLALIFIRKERIIFSDILHITPRISTPKASDKNIWKNNSQNQLPQLSLVSIQESGGGLTFQKNQNVTR